MMDSILKIIGPTNNDEEAQPCSECGGKVDTRNVYVWFCIGCAADVNTATGQMRNRYGQHVRNVCTELLAEGTTIPGTIPGLAW